MNLNIRTKMILFCFILVTMPPLSLHLRVFPADTLHSFNGRMRLLSERNLTVGYNFSSKGYGCTLRCLLYVR